MHVWSRGLEADGLSRRGEWLGPESRRLDGGLYVTGAVLFAQSKITLFSQQSSVVAAEGSRRPQVGLWPTRRPRRLVQICVQVVRHGTHESDLCEGVVSIVYKYVYISVAASTDQRGQRVAFGEQNEGGRMSR